MSYCTFAEAGVSSLAPSAIQRWISASWSACRASPFGGISALPAVSGVDIFSRLDSAGLPGTTAAPSSPPASSLANSVMT